MFVVTPRIDGLLIACYGCLVWFAGVGCLLNFVVCGLVVSFVNVYFACVLLGMTFVAF